MTEPQEKRQYPRARVACPVIMETSQGVVDGRTRDISLGGAFVQTWKPLKPKEVLYLAILDVPLLDHHLPIKAEVLRSYTSMYDDPQAQSGLGLRFSKISEVDRESLSTLISSHLQSQSVDWREKEP
jgi:c-di-GMP-binding flagellar brake protein YcgR